jgi:aspartate 1-decarboxylase
MRKFIAGKLHGISVTESNIDYHGSITLDPAHCEAAGLLPMEFVDIWNKNSGARISTYVIFGEKNSRCCILNGAAARTCQKGDELIICSSVYLEHGSLPRLAPQIVMFDRDNDIVEHLSYRVELLQDGTYHFEIRNAENRSLPVPALVSSTPV